SGGEIALNTSGAGTGGNLNLEASSILIDGVSSPDGRTAGIFVTSTARATGAAGKVAINATSLSLVNGGEISGNTGGPGNAGDLSISAKHVTLLAGGVITAGTSSSGKGGDLRITASDLSIDDRGNLDPTSLTGISNQSSRSASGAAGNLTIHTGTTRLLAGG